jgi:hypothetical protein
MPRLPQKPLFQETLSSKTLPNRLRSFLRPHLIKYAQVARRLWDAQSQEAEKAHSVVDHNQHDLFEDTQYSISLYTQYTDTQYISLHRTRIVKEDPTFLALVEINPNCLW